MEGLKDHHHMNKVELSCGSTNRAGTKVDHVPLGTAQEAKFPSSRVKTTKQSRSNTPASKWRQRNNGTNPSNAPRGQEAHQAAQARLSWSSSPLHQNRGIADVDGELGCGNVARVLARRRIASAKDGSDDAWRSVTCTARKYGLASPCGPAAARQPHLAFLTIDQVILDLTVG